MDRSLLPHVRLESRPAGLRWKAPDSAVARYDKSINLAAKAATGEIALTGYTGGDYTLDSVRSELKSIGSRSAVRLLINSPGGDAFEGIAIFNLLREHQGRITTCVLGLAASAASVIAMAGDRIEMGESSFLMIHSAAGMVIGNAADMSEFAGILDQIDRSVAELYARRSGLAVAEVLAMMRKETYLSAKDAVKKGFADVAIADPEQSSKASASLRSSLPALMSSALHAASGNPHAASVVMSLNPPGASGKFQGRTIMQTLQEKVIALREAKTAKLARQGELVKMREQNRESYGEQERNEFDTIDAELVELEDDLRAANFQLRESGMAQPVEMNAARGGGTYRRGAPYLNTKVKDQDEKFPGQNWTRQIIAKALSHNLHMSEVDIAQQRWGRTNPTLVEVIKMRQSLGIRMAAVPGGGTDSGEWGSELVTADSRYTGDFIEFLYAMTVFDQLPLREVPAHVQIKGTDGAATAYWVGQSKGIPATEGSAFSVNLTPLKVAALAVVSNELLADSSPAAEMWVRDMLAEAISQRVDQTFLSTAAAVSGVSPAGILEGVSAGTSAGATADNLRTDIEILMSSFIAARNVRQLAFVTSTGLALAIQLMRNALGQREFDGVSLTGGTLEGLRIYAGDNVGSGDLILLSPRDIWKIGDSGIQVAISREATIEQDTAPQGATDTPVAASANMTNMFQEDSTAIRLIRRLNFQKRRTSAVAYIGDAGYGGVAS